MFSRKLRGATLAGLCATIGGLTSPIQRRRGSPAGLSCVRVQPSVPLRDRRACPAGRSARPGRQGTRRHSGLRLSPAPALRVSRSVRGPRQADPGQRAAGGWVRSAAGEVLVVPVRGASVGWIRSFGPKSVVVCGKAAACVVSPAATFKLYQLEKSFFLGTLTVHYA